MRNHSFTFLAGIFIVMILGCQNGPESNDPPPHTEDEVIQTPEEVFVPEEEYTPQEEIIPEPEEDPIRDGAESTYQVTEEVYNNTFAEIEALITQLNTIIRDRNFRLWRSYLTQQYIDHISNPENLRQFSETPIMRHLGIRLRNLEDFFEFVVVPSRSNARLDELVFQDDTRVTAYMFINNSRSILYQLEKINGNWKITL